MKDTKELTELIDDLIDSDKKDKQGECTTKECMIKTDKSILERINKKIITEDGRELLI